MAKRRQTTRLISIALFLALVVLVTLLRLVPLGGYGTPPSESTGALFPSFGWARFPLPDILLALTFAWVLRRPDLLPAPLIAGYFFLEDLLLMRPPGLWAMLVLMGSEFLRRRSEQFRGYGFWFEYMVVAGLILALFLANRLILAIVMVSQDPFGLSFAQMLGTVLIYPVVVAVAHFGFGLRKPATGEVDALGQKL